MRLWPFLPGPLEAAARELPSRRPCHLVLEGRAAGPVSLLPESPGKEYGRAGNAHRRNSDGLPGIGARSDRLLQTWIARKSFSHRREARLFGRKPERDLLLALKLKKGESKAAREGAPKESFFQLVKRLASRLQ